MGGVVGVESEPGEGSTFWAEFPLCEAPQVSEDLDFEVKMACGAKPKARPASMTKIPLKRLMNRRWRI